MILLISAVFPPEPIVSANLSYDIATQLSKKGNEVTVISPKPSRPYGHVFVNEINTEVKFKHIILDSYISPKSRIFGRFIESYSFGQYSKKFISEHADEIEIVYINTWPLLAQYYAIKTAKKYSIPIILHIQDIYPESLAKKLPNVLSQIVQLSFVRFDKINLKNATKIIAISGNMKKFLETKRKIVSQKIDVVRNWQNDDKFISFRHKERKENNLFTFMYVGSISASAGVDHIIQAFKTIDNKDNKRLVIAGSGSDKEKCKKLASNSSSIEFWDAPYNEIPEIQSKADVLLLSLKKGVGLTASPSKFTAYLFSKKTVIASLDLESDTAKCIEESGCGFVCLPEDVTDLSNTMDEVSRISLEKLDEMGQKGYQYALNNLSKKENLKKITEIIQNN